MVLTSFLKLHVDRVNILRNIAIFYIWPICLEIAYSRPFWGSLGGYDGVPLELGTGARSQIK